MKVLIINHFPLTGSGSGVYTQNIANSLIKIGHEVLTVFPDNQQCNEDYKFAINPVYFTGEDENNETPKGALPFNFPCFTTHPRSKKTFDELTEEELSLYVEAFRNAIGNAVETFKPDVIHCGHIWILACVASEFGIPVVITSHGTDLMGIENSPRFSEFARKAANECSAIISISKGNLESLNRVLPEQKQKFHLILNGYNADVFYPDEVSRTQVLKSFGIEMNYKNVISFAGKFAHFKGIDILLKANKLYDTDDTATILAGDGELFDEMLELKNKLNLNNTFFIHNQPHDKLRQLYGIADASIVSSRNEPFGLVAIEAGACGAPIIGSKSGGLLDIIDKKTGLFFEQENHFELASYVNSILNGDVVFNRKLTAQTTYERFSQDIFTKQLVKDVYEQII